MQHMIKIRLQHTCSECWASMVGMYPYPQDCATHNFKSLHSRLLNIAPNMIEEVIINFLGGTSILHEVGQLPKAIRSMTAEHSFHEGHSKLRRADPIEIQRRTLRSSSLRHILDNQRSASPSALMGKVSSPQQKFLILASSWQTRLLRRLHCTAGQGPLRLCTGEYMPQYRRKFDEVGVCSRT